MSAANGSAVPGETITEHSKGKGKAIEQPNDMSMDEDEDSSEGEESGIEEPVSLNTFTHPILSSSTLDIKIGFFTD
jgi:hypothetical protein